MGWDAAQTEGPCACVQVQFAVCLQCDEVSMRGFGWVFLFSMGFWGVLLSWGGEGWMTEGDRIDGNGLICIVGFYF